MQSMNPSFSFIGLADNEKKHYRISSIFVQRDQTPRSYLPLSSTNCPHITIMECLFSIRFFSLQAITPSFYQTLVKLVCNENGHTISDKFDFGRNGICHFEVTCL